MRWMAPFEAVGIIESLDGESHDEEELLSAWQNLVDSGVVWQLQGWYGRAAVNLIERGLVTVKGGESNGNLHFVNSRSE